MEILIIYNDIFRDTFFLSIYRFEVNNEFSLLFFVYWKLNDLLVGATSFLFLLFLKESIIFCHYKLKYSFWLCNFHWSFYPVFHFPFYEVPKLNEQECKFQQEVFIIKIQKCLKLPSEKSEYVFVNVCFFFI